MDTKIEARRTITRPPSMATCGAFKTVDYATKSKFYTASVMGKALRRAFDRNREAVNYAQKVYDRYQSLLAAEREMNKENEL